MINNATIIKFCVMCSTIVVIKITYIPFYVCDDVNCHCGICITFVM